MIASYAWSNMMIINLVNIKVNYFPSEEMDIFIRMTPGISRDIISLCRNIFSEVYYMETPRIQLKGFFHRKNLFKFLKDAILYNRQYNRLLENSIDNKVY